jgi:hypothetical protein
MGDVFFRENVLFSSFDSKISAWVAAAVGGMILRLF